MIPGEKHKNGIAGHLFQLFQAFSLDVVVGSLAIGFFAVQLLHVHPNPWWWLVLALSVWVVYTGDHLLDGFQRKQAATMFRHRIHYRFRYLFMVVLLLAALSAVVLTRVFLDSRIFQGGLALGLAALVYLGLVYLARKRGFYFQKELVISLFYVAGIWLAPVIWQGSSFSYVLIAGVAILFLLAWAEGLIMACFEHEYDSVDKTHSFSTFYGLARTKKLSAVLLISALTFSLVVAFSKPVFQREFILLAVLSAFLILLLIFPSFFKQKGRYRLLGEFSFWLPFVLMI